MSQIEFDQSDTFKSSVSGPAPKGFVGFLIKKGIVKDKTSANFVLIGIAVVFFAVSIYLFSLAL